jgi:hypothetical protein
MMILVISVVGASAGDILKDTFGTPAFVGTAAIMVLTALLVFYGSPAVERFLALWSFVLCGAYLSFFDCHLVQNGGDVAANPSAADIGEAHEDHLWFGPSSKFGLRFPLQLFNLPPPSSKTPTTKLGIGSVPTTSLPPPAKIPTLLPVTPHLPYRQPDS